MGIIVGNEQEKAHLIKEICSESTRADSCFHLRHPHINRSPFIDWYLILKVNENAEIKVIRKQYHKLALQLHPDKNKHPNAETAFKLVSEAYFCLSDDVRRAAFDSQRKTSSCTECHGNNNPCNQTNVVRIQTPRQQNSRFNRFRRRMKEIGIKLEEEAAIIEKCIATNAGTRSEPMMSRNWTRRELPVFNPSDYQYKGYPCRRTINCEKLRVDFIMSGSRWMQKKDSPVFDYRSQRA